MNIQKQLKEIENSFPYAKKQNNKISAVSVGWQLNHCLEVINSVTKVIPTTNPKQYKPHFNFAKVFVLLTGYIPRGKGKAPNLLNKKDNLELDILETALTIAKSKINSLNALDQNHYFKHPYFGHLNIPKAKRFLTIHTEHHFKIVRDILKK